MKDYTDYNNHAKDILLNSSVRTFNIQLQAESQDIKIQDKIIKAIVRNHGNPTNEFKEERYLIAGKEVDIKRGYIVNYLDEDYIIITDVDKDNEVYNTCKMLRTNYILKWMDLDGTPQQCPCIVQNQTLYTTGITPVKYEDEGNAKESIMLPSNENTLNVKRDKRLIINGNFWRITNINKDTEGIINLICSESKYNSAIDNLKLGIADYHNNIHTYKLEINTTPITLNINETLQLDIKAYDNDVIVENPQINYSILNADILQIENNTIKPLKVGTTKLNVQFKNITKEIEINIVDVNNNNYFHQLTYHNYYY